MKTVKKTIAVIISVLIVIFSLSACTNMTDKFMESSINGDVTERTVHLDCARKYFSPQWIMGLIDDMALMHYTSLELHFSEDQALRIESKTFPWLTEGIQALTQEEVAEICDYAYEKGIEIIPSFDSPGHMDAIVTAYADYTQNHPDFTFEYDGVTYGKDSPGFANISNYFMYNGCRSDYNYRGIDISNETAVAFTRALLTEYAALFREHGATKFNIGGDELLGWSEIVLGGQTFDFSTKWNALQHWEEYARDELDIENGSSSDAFIAYLNDTASVLEEMGYTCRVWSDEINRNDDQHIALSKSIGIVYWSNDFAPAEEFIKEGYTLYNALETWTYYVVRGDENGDFMDSKYQTVNQDNIYENWNPLSLAQDGNGSEPGELLGGAYFCIWCDMADYKTDSVIHDEINGRMWASSARMLNISKAEELSMEEYINAVMEAGWDQQPFPETAVE